MTIEESKRRLGLFGILAGMALAAGMGMLAPRVPLEQAVSWPRWLPLELHVAWAWVAPMLVLGFYMGSAVLGDFQAKTESALTTGMDYSVMLAEQSLGKLVTLILH